MKRSTPPTTPLFNQYGQEGEPIHPSTTKVFEGVAEGGAAFNGEIVERKVGVWVGTLERVWVTEWVWVTERV